jgi:hypothetical protein
LIYFFDRNIGVRLARMLDAYDGQHTVRHLDDDTRFPKTVSDIDMIHVLSTDNPRPVFVTADVNMRTRIPEERNALAGSELTCVFLRRGFHALPFHTQAVKLLSIWPEIVRETIRCSEPTTFEVAPAAIKVQRLCPTRNLADRR